MAELPPIPDAPMSALRLRPLRLDDEHAVHAAQRAMADDDFEFAFDLANDTDWPSYLTERARQQRGIDVPSDQVPASFLVATLDEVIVGRASIRHQLKRLATRLRRSYRLRRAATVPAPRVHHRDPEADPSYRTRLRRRSRPPHLR